MKTTILSIIAIATPALALNGLRPRNQSKDRDDAGEFEPFGRILKGSQAMSFSMPTANAVNQDMLKCPDKKKGNGKNKKKDDGKGKNKEKGIPPTQKCSIQDMQGLYKIKLDVVNPGGKYDSKPMRGFVKVYRPKGFVKERCEDPRRGTGVMKFIVCLKTPGNSAVFQARNSAVGGRGGGGRGRRGLDGGPPGSWQRFDYFAAQTSACKNSELTFRFMQDVSGGPSYGRDISDGLVAGPMFPTMDLASTQGTFYNGDDHEMYHEMWFAGNLNPPRCTEQDCLVVVADPGGPVFGGGPIYPSTFSVSEPAKKVNPIHWPSECDQTIIFPPVGPPMGEPPVGGPSFPPVGEPPVGGPSFPPVGPPMGEPPVGGPSMEPPSLVLFSSPAVAPAPAPVQWSTVEDHPEEESP